MSCVYRHTRINIQTLLITTTLLNNLALQSVRKDCKGRKRQTNCLKMQNNFAIKYQKIFFQKLSLKCAKNAKNKN